MGMGGWSSDKYVSYAAATNYKATRSHVDNFKQREVAKSHSVKKISKRESRDSVDNPNSTPIIVGLDVTGSMGMYADKISKDSLPIFMEQLLEKKPVVDPHVMFLGIDDIHSGIDTALQATQFEADIRILEQLRDLYMVGRGGGNRSESYDLAWYFAARMTSTDAYEKRHQKGYLFTIGDEEAPYQSLEADDLSQLFGGQVHGNSLQPGLLLEEASEKYHVFHITVMQGDYASRAPEKTMKSWNDLLGKASIPLYDFSALPEVMIAALQIANGADVETVISESSKSDELRKSLGHLLG